MARNYFYNFVMLPMLPIEPVKYWWLWAWWNERPYIFNGQNYCIGRVTHLLTYKRQRNSKPIYAYLMRTHENPNILSVESPETQTEFINISHHRDIALFNHIYFKNLLSTSKSCRWPEFILLSHKALQKSNGKSTLQKIFKERRKHWN